MASHKKHAQPTTFALPGKSQMVKIVATVAAVGLLATGGIVSHNLYATAEKSPAKQVTAYSVTDSIEASRGNAREALSGDTSYVTVKINGKTRVVPGMHFTDVKSVLDAGDITLDTEDTVSPSLDTKVNENTVIKIERAGASVEVSDRISRSTRSRRRPPACRRARRRSRPKARTVLWRPRTSSPSPAARSCLPI